MKPLVFADNASCWDQPGGVFTITPYPYLLRGLAIERVNQVWSTEVTFIPMSGLTPGPGVQYPGNLQYGSETQFTSQAFTQTLLDRGIQISVDGRGRALDTIFVERLWRTVKYENIYLNDYQSVRELRLGLQQYFEFYNQQRLHQSPDYQASADASFWKVCF